MATEPLTGDRNVQLKKLARTFPFFFLLNADMEGYRSEKKPVSVPISTSLADATITSGNKNHVVGSVLVVGSGK